jgi:hypothetical protein
VAYSCLLYSIIIEEITLTLRMNWMVHLATNKHSSLEKINACILQTKKGPQAHRSLKNIVFYKRRNATSITDSSYRIIVNNLINEQTNSMDHYPA